MTTSHKPADERPRRNPRFGLRWLLAGIAAISVLCACYAWIAEGHRQEQRVVRRLTEHGWSFEWRAIGPSWVSATERVVSAYSPPSQASARTTKDDFAQLLRLKHLEVLDLTGTELGDAEIQRLAELTGLKRVDLSSTAVSDLGLKHLQRLHELDEVILDFTGSDFGGQITDRGIAQLLSSLALRSVGLAGTDASAESVQALNNCAHLELVDLRDSHVDPKQAEDLRRTHPSWTIFSD